MPVSVLWKQAMPGGRKRSGQAVNDGLDGRSERQASGRGHPRAAACWLYGTLGRPAAGWHRGRTFRRSSRTAPGFLSAIRLMSSGVPMPASVLWKQAMPGGRKRSGQAVNDGLDGRSERQASGRGHPRAAACWLYGTLGRPAAGWHRGRTFRRSSRTARSAGCGPRGAVSRSLPSRCRRR